MSIGTIKLDIADISQEDTIKYQEILAALVASGVLGLKGGKATLHFDGGGQFMGIEVNFWSFRRKKVD